MSRRSKILFLVPQARTGEEDGGTTGPGPAMGCPISPFNLIIGTDSSVDGFQRRECFARKFFSAMKDLRPRPAALCPRGSFLVDRSL